MSREYMTQDTDHLGPVIATTKITGPTRHTNLFRKGVPYNLQVMSQLHGSMEPILLLNALRNPLYLYNQLYN